MKNLINRLGQSIVSVIVLVILATLLNSCSKDDHINNPTKKTYVLVHGSFQAAYTWNGVKAELEQQGNNVIVVELPGHGVDVTDPASITMDAYRDKVISSIKDVNGQVILVGHSMGGMVISAVAEAVPDKIERLIYLAAFVPKSGQSLIELASMDTEGQLAPLLVPSADQLTLGIKDITKIPAIFCEDGSTDTKQILIDKYRPDPAIPFNNKITLSEANFGSVNKSYILTTNDKAFGISLQNQMVLSGNIKDVYTIESSHCPHLSKAKELSQLLLKISS